MIDQVDARYFTIVNDNWDHAAKQIRRSGNRLSFLVIPLINSYFNFSEYDNSSTVYTTERKDVKYNLQFQLNFIHDKPINLHWQRRFSVLLSGNYMQGLYESINDDLKDEIEINSPQLDSRLQYSLAYYPNSRTTLNMRADINFKNYFGTEDFDNIENDINYLNITPRIDIGLNYYISPQLLLDVGYYIYYDYTESNSNFYDHVNYNDFIKRNQVNHSINIGFKYQIF